MTSVQIQQVFLPKLKRCHFFFFFFFKAAQVFLKKVTEEIGNSMFLVMDEQKQQGPVSKRTGLPSQILIN